jgi:hypothetical protein
MRGFADRAAGLLLAWDEAPNAPVEQRRDTRGRSTIDHVRSRQRRGASGPRVKKFFGSFFQKRTASLPYCTAKFRLRSAVVSLL